MYIQIRKFQTAHPIPQIGWNTNYVDREKSDSVEHERKNDWESWIVSRGRMYFVHSFRLGLESIDELKKDGWRILVSQYDGEPFISCVRKGKLIGTQFHPEKSGIEGLSILKRFIQTDNYCHDFLKSTINVEMSCDIVSPLSRTNLENLNGLEYHKNNFKIGGQFSNCKGNGLAKRIIACLDVRELDDGQLAVTKGDQYNVREDGKVRNLGHPKDLAEKYFNDGVDEIVFLSIKSYNKIPSYDNPMLKLIHESSKCVFVPLCVGGGIRDIVEYDKESHLEIRRIPAVEIAAAYFKAGES